MGRKRRSDIRRVTVYSSSIHALAAIHLMKHPVLPAVQYQQIGIHLQNMAYLALTLHGAIERFRIRTFAFRASELASVGTTNFLAAIGHCE